MVLKDVDSGNPASYKMRQLIQESYSWEYTEELCGTESSPTL